ncbi:MAG: tail fiber protein [Rhodanobacter sp.]
MSEPFVGEIRLFGFPRIPNGWLPCDGGVLSIAQYDVLFALIGTTYGGDGVTSFSVPDLRGRVPVHQGVGPGLPEMVIGMSSGSETVTLLATELPNHTHPMQATSANANTFVPGSAVQVGALANDKMYTTDIAGATPLPMNPTAVSAAGGNQPHDNLMPTLTVSYCIAYSGIYPSQN